MDRIGPDLHKREAQLCTLAEAGTVSERWIATTRERLTAVLGGRAPARVRRAGSTESEWVAAHVRTRGHAVVGWCDSGRGARTVAWPHDEAAGTRRRLRPTANPRCAGDDHVPTGERDQKAEAPRGRPA